MAKRDTLSNRERLFVREYLIDLNARQASIRAGYSPRSSTHGLASRPRVKAAIESVMAARSAALDITAERVLHEIALMGFANFMDYFTLQADGTAHVDLSGLTREQAAGIAAVEVDEFKSGRGAAGREVKRVKVKLADKKGSLELIGKHLGLFARKPGVTEEKGEGVDVHLSDLELAQRLLDDAVFRGKGETDENGS